MNYSVNYSISYVKNGMHHLICQSDETLKLTPVIRQISETEQTITLHIKNCSGQEVYLKTATLWSASGEEALSIGRGPFDVYRSGRHKNDMPGTFTTGVKDERMTDLLGAMSESGDKTEGRVGMRRLLSDHLTVIKGDGKSLVISFDGGREQLFETVILLDEEYQLGKISANVIFNILLPAEAERESETVRLTWTDGVEEQIERFALRKAEKFGKRCGKRPSVFCTWYYYGLTVTYEDVKTNLDVMKKRELPFDVFQVDEGWEVTLGEWRPNHKFPVPMKQVAEEIKEAGYRPGIWTSPFIAHETASVWKEHPEWRLCDKEGTPYLFPMNDTVYQVFDITNPETYTYFTELYRMLTFDWGYTYHKLDFTRAAVIYEDADFYDKTVTLAQAYYRAVSAIRKGMGEEAYFLMCGGLYDPIIGLVDAQRTGSDVLSMWSSTVNKNGKTAPYTIKQSVYRYYMNKWWDNDPDALMIRKNETMERDLRLTYGLLNDEEVKTSVMNQFMGGGIMCTTEPLDKISDDRLMEYRRVLPVLPGEVRPVNLMESVRFPGMVDVYSKEQDAHYLCVVNWNDAEEKVIELCIKERIPDFVKQGGRYVICDYYAGEYHTGVDANKAVAMKAIAPHGAGLYKVVRMQDMPLVVKSTAHYTMGGEFERLSWEDGVLHYAVENAFDYENSYEILLPDGRAVSLTVPRGRAEGKL